MSDRSPGRQRANWDAFKIVNANVAVTPLNFRTQYSVAEWELIRLGSIPRSRPDDRWVIVEKDGSVYFAQSMSGRVVYKVDFTVGSDGATVRRAVMNIRTAQTDDAWRAHYARVLEWLIGFWLLGREFESPPIPEPPKYTLRPQIELVRDPLPFIPGIDAVAYGAKDTGTMGGGAAAAILAAAGEELIREARKKLAATSRRIGDAVFTYSYGLQKLGILYVGHILSIITDTPQGDWCPYPDKLYDGVALGLKQLAQAGAGTVGISALATGEGRVKPADAARFMLPAIRDHQRGPGRKVNVVLSLPTYEDYEAFETFYSQL